MKQINLGCGNTPMEGYTNHDLTKHRKEIDIAFDLDKTPWPLKDNEWDLVNADDVLEHLEDVVKTMNEIWRILKPEGQFKCKVCGYGNPAYHIDITHHRAFHFASMDYFDPTTEIGKEYSYYTDKKWRILETHTHRKNYYFTMKPIK